MLILWKAIHSSQIWSFLLMSPNISYIEGTPFQVSQHQDTLHVAAMSLNELNEPNVQSFPLTQLHLNFPNPARYFTSQEKRRNWVLLSLPNAKHTRQQKSLNVPVNAFSTEHNWWLCTLPLWQATQMVSHLVSHTYRFPSRSAEPLTVCQFKYWGNGASENMTMYMTIYTPFKIQGTNKQF